MTEHSVPDNNPMHPTLYQPSNSLKTGVTIRKMLMKPSQKSKRVIAKLLNLKEILGYYMGSSPQFMELVKDLKEVEDYIIEVGKSRTLVQAEVIKQLKENV